MGYLYISYSRRNAEVAQRLVTDLQARGYTFWIDSRDLDTSETWNDQIERAIREAEAFLVLLSPDSVSSRTVQNEIDLAEANRKPIIPVSIQPGQIPPSLMNHQVVDASGDWAEFIDHLVNAIDASTASLRMRSMKAAPPAPAAAEAAMPVRAQRRASPLRLLLVIIPLFVVIALVLLTALAASGPAIGNVFSNIVNDLNEGTLTSGVASPTPQTGSEATQSAASPLPGATPTIQSSELLVGTRVALAVESTVAAFSATESSVLSPAEAAQMASLTGDSVNVGYFSGILAALALGVSIGALVVFWLSGGRRLPRQTGHPSAHHGGSPAHPESVLPEQMLEDYHIFASSSEKDKDWVRMLVDDLEALGYLVWWYAKDAPGLPFGNEIRSAIYHTKVFLIVVSPDSMRSKHIEEEIRWAEIYDRPIIPVVCRATTIEERLYGLAKGADINFTDDYKEALEFLAQAIDHYLQTRLEKMQAVGDSDGADGALPTQGL